jgi:peptide/nickel transport system substrate-binding protein
MLDNKTAAFNYFPTLASVNQVDDNTVDFILRSPDFSVLASMAAFLIMPKAYYTTVGKDGFAVKPIGSGPYELTEFRANDRAVFKKRATEHAIRKPALTQITFLNITEQGQLVNGYRTGTLDAFAAPLNQDSLVQVAKTDAVVDSLLATVQVAQFPRAEMEARQTPLRDKRVRLALNYAIDKEAIVKAVYGGYGKPVGQTAIPNSPAYDESIPPFPYDVAQAKALLADAGYPNGFTLSGGIDFNPLRADANAAVLIQSYFKAVGVEIAINNLENAVYLDRFRNANGALKGDIFLLQQNGVFAGGGASSSYYSCSKPANMTTWCNPEFDKNMDLALSEPDPAKRAELLRKANRVFTDDVANLFLYTIPTFVILSPKIKGFSRQSPFNFNLDGMYRIN